MVAREMKFSGEPVGDALDPLRDAGLGGIGSPFAAQPQPNFPRLRALALFGRRPPEQEAPLVMLASKNLHNGGHSQFDALPRRLPSRNVFAVSATATRARPVYISRSASWTGSGNATIVRMSS